MPDSEQDPSENHVERPFNITPFHPLWVQMERGIQILLGFSLVTSIHFLAETWGSPNIPYKEIFPAIGSVGFAFIWSLIITPIAGYVGIILRAITNWPTHRINQIRAIIFNLVLLALLIVFFSEASRFIGALALAVGLDPTLDSTWK